jgi:hypothetical protein
MLRWTEIVPPLLRRDAKLRAAKESQARYGRRVISGDIAIAFPATTLDFSMRPPLGEGGVAAFEAKYGVRVPQPYRTYVRDVADGGAGPGYGVFPLGVRDAVVIGDLMPDYDLPLLGKPFDRDAALTLELAEVDEEDDDAVEAADEEYFDPNRTAGAMFINHYGCALRAMIVMNGPWTGRIILDLRAEQGGIMPFDRDAARRFHHCVDAGTAGEPLPFDEWYESWLYAYQAGVGA